MGLKLFKSHACRCYW